MVKNVKGGNKSKKMGRKFLSAPVDRKVRFAQEDGEIYAVVTKLLGNGQFYANDSDGKERLVIMRNKFCGRGKRDNIVTLGGWVLIGERHFESCSKPKHDLLEVYNEMEKEKLKKSGNPIFLKLKSEHDLNSLITNNDDGFVIEKDDDTNIDELISASENNNNTDTNKQMQEETHTLIKFDDEEINIEDI